MEQPLIFYVNVPQNDYNNKQDVNLKKHSDHPQRAPVIHTVFDSFGPLCNMTHDKCFSEFPLSQKSPKEMTHLLKSSLHPAAIAPVYSRKTAGLDVCCIKNRTK